MEQAPLNSDGPAERTKPEQRVSLARATAWIDRNVPVLAAETLPLRQAYGRILARDVRSGVDVPASARAAIDGVALLAQAIIGAHNYQPVNLRLGRGPIDKFGRSAVRVEAGDPMPAGADAVVALDACAFCEPGWCEVFAPVPPGYAVEPTGSLLGHDTPLLAAGQCLEPRHIALMAEAAAPGAPVVRQPRVAVILNGHDHGRLAVVATLLQGLIERDGGLLTVPPCRDLEQLPDFGPSKPDIAFVIGRAGSLDDAPVQSLAALGEVAILGIALAPGESTAIGIIPPASPVFVLPVAPAGCLWAYEWLAGRALRRLAGRALGPPLRSQVMRIRRKIVSRIGMTEIFPVRCVGQDAVEPDEVLAETDLLAAVKADGFVITPEGSEGYADGSLVEVHWQKSYDNLAIAVAGLQHSP
jgi:molybdopterin molybdotransferase